MLRREDYIFIIVSSIILLFSSTLSPLYGMPMACDPHIYSSVGRGIIDGLVPYKDLFDQKGPLIFFLYGLCQWGLKSFTGILIVEIFCLSVSMSLGYRLALFWLSKGKAFLLSLCLPFLLCRFAYFENGGNPSEFLLPLQFGGVYVLTGMVLDPSRFSPIKVGGILGIGVAVALMMKFNLCCFWVFPLCVGILYSHRQHKLLPYLGAFILGALLIVLPIFVYFFSHDAVREMIDGYFLFSTVYGLQTHSIGEVLGQYAILFKSVLVEDISFFLMVWGVLLVLFNSLSRFFKVGYSVSLIFCFLCLFGSARMQCGHYLITLIPYVFIGLLLTIKYLHIPLSERGKIIFIPLLSVLCVAYTLCCSVNIKQLISSKKDMNKERNGLVSLIPQNRSFALLQTNDQGMYWLLNRAPDIRLFTICSGTTEVKELLCMEQYREVAEKRIDFLAISPKQKNSPNQSAQALCDLIRLKYHKIGIVEKQSNIYELFEKNADTDS